MTIMQSTTAQFGGFVFSTDNDEHPIISSVQRILDIWALVGIQMNILLMAAVPAFDGLNRLCHRLLAWMDLMESGVFWTGDIIEAGLEACALVYDTFMMVMQPLGAKWTG